MKSKVKGRPRMTDRVSRQAASLVMNKSAVLAGMTGLMMAVSTQAAVSYSINSIGLIDSTNAGTGITYTDANTGGAYQSISVVNSAGYIGGTSTRFSSTTTSGVTTVSTRGADAWLYNAATGTTIQVGYTTDRTEDTDNDYGYTNPTGYRNSKVIAISSAGYAAGTTQIYDQLSTSNSSIGADAWLYNITTGSYARLGLLDSIHTSEYGLRNNAITAINSSGVVIGTSQRLAYSGTDAYIYDPSTDTVSRQIGLTGSDYGSTGYSVTSLAGINSNSYVAGVTSYTAGGSYSTSDAWIYNPNTQTSTRIGLMTTGYRGDTIFGFNNYGVAATTANTSDTTLKQAWIYKIADGSVTQVGLTSTDYTKNGNTSSTITAFTDTGYAAGSTSIMKQYTGGQIISGYANSGYTYTDAVGQWYTAGQDAWVYDGNSTIKVGLYDKAEYTGADSGTPVNVLNFSPRNGYYYQTSSTQVRYSAVTSLTSTGNAIGYTYVFNGSDSNGAALKAGQDAWTYQVGGTTKRVGLIGAGYVSSDNIARSSTASYVNNAGYVVGTSTRYSSTATSGTAAWYDKYSTASTNTSVSNSVRLGLTGSAHTATDGTNTYQYSTVTALTNSGLVAGYSTRYYNQGVTVGSTSITANGNNGQDAWVYDLTTATPTQYIMGIAANDAGYAYSTISLMTEDGLILGTYNTYSGSTVTGTYLYAWTAGSSMTTISDSIDYTLSDEDWSKISSLFGVDANGNIYGTGIISGMGATADTYSTAVAFVLSQAAVPEPASLSMLALGTVLMVRRRK